MKYVLSVDGVSVEALFNKFEGAENAKRFVRGELVLVEASYLLQLQQASLPPIDNCMLYEVLGMKDQYAKAMEGKRMPAQDPNLWDLLVLPEVTCNMVMAQFKDLGLATSDWCKDWDAELDPKYEGPKAQTPYLLGFTRSLTGDPSTESANDRWKKFLDGVEGYNDPILRDGLLLDLGVYLATGKKQLLNLEKWTRTRSRFRSGNVADFDVYPGWVPVRSDNPDYASPGARVRPAVSRQLEPSGAKA